MAVKYPSWKTRLVAYYVDPDTSEKIVITPLQSLVPTFTTPQDEFDSVEKERIGYIRRPKRFTFNMTVFASGQVVARLTDIQLKSLEFSIGIEQALEDGGNPDYDGIDNDWTFNDILLDRCVIIGSTPSNITINNIPVATFNCKALSAKPTIESDTPKNLEVLA